MTHAPDQMSADFLPYADKIAELTASDGAFADIMKTYEELNASIYNAEQKIEPMDDLALETLKKQRLALKDQIFASLSK
jgi:uncharacterized protein YdcH (DUF465 family)